ncbi:MAG: hypothetical protein VYC39_11865 [Myxococcota bacterium]|nr:hypothetical protein [Myxococcota bacterium]
MRFTYVLLVGLLLKPQSVEAHGLNGGMSILRLAGNVLYVTATPSQQLFAQFDQNTDKNIDKDELHSQRGAILALFKEMLVVTDQEGNKGQLIFEDVSLPHSHPADGVDEAWKHLTFNIRYQWQTQPQWLDLHYLGAEVSPLNTQAQKFSPAQALVNQRPLEPAVSGQLNSSKAIVRFFESSGNVRTFPVNKQGEWTRERILSFVVVLGLGLALVRLFVGRKET